MLITASAAKNSPSARHAGHAPVRGLDARRRRAEPQRAALLLNCADQRVHQRLGAAFDIAELFLHQRLARGADALEARPDPGRRDVVGVFEELEPEQRRPHLFVDGSAAPARDPVLGRDVLQAPPVVAPGREEHHGAVAQLLDQRELRKAEQRNRIAPGVELAVEEIAHRGRHPAHPVAEPELGQQVKRRLIRLADEMVVALDRQPAEIEMRGHAARFGRCFEHRHLVSALERMIGGGKPHRAGADDNHAAHQNSSTICEYTGWR